MKPVIVIIALLPILFGTWEIALAQYHVTPDVFGCGGQPAQNASYRLNGTVGEPAIGVTQNAVHTKYLGFWYITAGNVTSIDRVVDGEPSFRLEQNYPNPVTGDTRISFMLSEMEEVELSITDACGRRIATPVHASLSPGSYQVTWDAATLPPGIYLYTLRTPTRSATRRCILIR